MNRWRREGEPDPLAWVLRQSSEATRRNARASLVWYHRTELGQSLRVPSVPQTRHTPRAYTSEELARLQEAALGVQKRCRPTIDLLYTTGARVSELVAVAVEDVTDTHLLLRETKRRPSGLRVERLIPLNRTSRAAVGELCSMPPGRSNILVGVCKRLVQDWMVTLQARTGVRCYAHKFRSTFATTMLERGVDVRTVMELMGHTNLATTLKYLAVSDERLRAAVEVL